jgi:hypothetical protein
MGNCKCVRNSITKSLKHLREAPSNSIYHMAALLVKEIWKTCDFTLSSINELDEHHKWYVMMCMEEYSLDFPLNLGMFDGILVGMTDHEGLWVIGSFVKCDKSGKYNVARK